MSESFPRSNSSETSIESNRLLLLRGGSNGMREFFDKALMSRVIVMPKESNQASMYENMLIKRLPVFSGVYRDDELLLTVPDDARSLRRQLKFVARDIPNYGYIFNKLGITLSAVNRSGLGLPEPSANRPLLANFAFSSIEQDEADGNVYIVPPFNLNPNITIDKELLFVRRELEHSKQFKSTEVRELMDKVESSAHAN